MIYYKLNRSLCTNQPKPPTFARCYGYRQAFLIYLAALCL